MPPNRIPVNRRMFLLRCLREGFFERFVQAAQVGGRGPPLRRWPAGLLSMTSTPGGRAHDQKF